MDKALKQLNPIYRQIVVLKYYNDLSEGEISKYLGVPVGTVKSRLYRARLFLRNTLVKQNEGVGYDAKDKDALDLYLSKKNKGRLDSHILI